MDLLKTILPLYGNPTPSGCTPEEIDILKQRFGTIPQVVEDFYRLAAKTHPFHTAQDTWILPENYKTWPWLQKIDALVLLVENQGVCLAAIRREDLTHPDPPVYVSYWKNQNFSTDWQPCANTTTEFFSAALAYQAAFTFPFDPETFYWYTPEEKNLIQANLTPLPFYLKNWCSEMEITLYQNAPDNLLALMSFQGEDDSQTLYGAVTEQSYQKLLSVVGNLGEEI